MKEPSGPGCCASFLLAIPGYLLLQALGLHDEPAFWISFLTVLIGGGILIPFLYWKRRSAQHQANPAPAGRRVDPTGARRFWRDSP